MIPDNNSISDVFNYSKQTVKDSFHKKTLLLLDEDTAYTPKGKDIYKKVGDNPPPIKKCNVMLLSDQFSI